METTILQVIPEDDLNSIRDRIEWTKAQRVILVLTRKNRRFAHRINLELLKRSVQSNGKQLAIVTKDPAIRECANLAAINTYRSILTAESTFWPGAENARLERNIKGKNAIQQERQRLPGISKEWNISRQTRNFFWFLLVSIFLALILTFLPASRVVIYPITETQQMTLEIRASTQVDQPNITGLIPATIQQFDLTGEISSTSSGSVKIGISKAKGLVTVNNLAASPIDLPSGVIFSTSGENLIRFISEEPVTVPNGLEGIQLMAEAVLPGEEGNIPAGEISKVEGNYGTMISVTNMEPFTGGESSTLPAPTSYDYSQLREKQLRVFHQQMVKDNPGSEDWAPIPESLKLSQVLEEVQVNPVGVASDTARLLMSARFSMLFYDPKMINEIATRILDLSILDGYHPIGDEVVIKPDGEIQIEASGDAVWYTVVSRKIVKDISRKEILDLIKGREISRGLQLLDTEIPHIRSAEVIQLIPWWPYLPVLESRIRIEERVNNEG